MKEKITPYLKQQLHNKEIFYQYTDTAIAPTETYSDPLNEESHERVKGLIHKYDNRALIKVSYQCAAHCRFCTRIRQIGDPAGTLNDTDIDNIITYLAGNPQIDDVILSGGDPIYTPLLTERILTRLRSVSSVKVLRIGSRLALQSPQSFQSETIKRLLRLVDEIGQEKPFYILLHINSPKELTDEVITVIRMLKRLNVTLLSQTVFLKNINDSFEALSSLFTTLYHLGIIPYYLYHCDSVKGLETFAVDMKTEIEIVKKLCRHLSGIACPTFVIDVENGYGKIPVSLDFTNFAEHTLVDFKGNVSVL